MKYLKKVDLKRNVFTATFVNGEKTNDVIVGKFFMAMQEKDAGIEDLDSYIKLGERLDYDKPWHEIKRIANTFKEAQPQQKD